MDETRGAVPERAGPASAAPDAIEALDEEAPEEA
jgi:hypothetical protein